MNRKSKFFQNYFIYKNMEWTIIFSTLIFCFALQCHPYLIPDDTSQVSSSWSTLPVTTSHKMDTKSDDIVDVLKALDLPPDFAGSDKKKLKATNSVKNQKKKFRTPSTTLPSSSLYVTGSPRLDKILNCPCKREQLDLVGVQGNLYKPPQYFPTVNFESGSNNDVGVSKSVKTIKVIKKSRLVGTAKGSKDTSMTGNIFGSAFRLLPDLPSFNFSFMDFLQPILAGFASTTLSQTFNKNVVAKKPSIPASNHLFPMSLSVDNSKNSKNKNKIPQTKIIDVGPKQKTNTFKSHFSSSSNPYNPSIVSKNNFIRQPSQSFPRTQTFGSLMDSGVDLVTASPSLEFTSKKPSQSGSGSFAKSVSITMLVTSDDIPESGSNKTLPLVQRTPDLKLQLRESIKNDIQNYRQSKTL